MKSTASLQDGSCASEEDGGENGDAAEMRTLRRMGRRRASGRKRKHRGKSTRNKDEMVWYGEGEETGM